MEIRYDKDRRHELEAVGKMVTASAMPVVVLSYDQAPEYENALAKKYAKALDSWQEFRHSFDKRHSEGIPMADNDPLYRKYLKLAECFGD